MKTVEIRIGANDSTTFLSEPKKEIFLPTNCIMCGQHATEYIEYPVFQTESITSESSTKYITNSYTIKLGMKIPYCSSHYQKENELRTTIGAKSDRVFKSIMLFGILLGLVIGLVMAITTNYDGVMPFFIGTGIVIIALVISIILSAIIATILKSSFLKMAEKKDKDVQNYGLFLGILNITIKLDKKRLEWVFKISLHNDKIAEQVAQINGGHIVSY